MLEGKRVTLRLVREDDLAEMVQRDNDLKEKTEFASIRLQTLQKLKTKYAEDGCWGPDNGTLLLTDKEDRLLGFLCFFKGPHYQQGFEVGYSIYRHEDRGKGYMSEALALFSAYLFASQSIPRLQICTSEENKASSKVAQKCGYTYEGTLRKYFFLRGKLWNAEIYSLLREECPPLATLPTNDS